MGVGETGLAVSAHVDISYRVTRHLDEGAMAVALEWLSAEERARCARLAFASDRRGLISAPARLDPPLSGHPPGATPEAVFVPNANPETLRALGPRERPQRAVTTTR